MEAAATPRRVQPPEASSSLDEGGPWWLPRRWVGALLIALTVLPLHRLLSAETGLAGAATVAMTDHTRALAWSGLLVVVLVGVLAARLVPYVVFARYGTMLCDAMLRPRAPVFAAVLAVLAFALAAAFNVFVLAGQPNLIDAMSALLHARYIATGQLAGHGPDAGAFIHLQQSLYTENGWASQYPPGHIVLLAIGLRLGVPGMVGPLMLGIAVFFTTLAAERLLPHRLVAARLGALFAAVSAFGIAQAGAFMSHAPAAAFGALAIYGVAREKTFSGPGSTRVPGPSAAPGTSVVPLHGSSTGRGSWGWALLSGAALGALFATRPLTAVAIGAVVLLAVRPAPSRWIRMVAGGLPFALGVFAWNNALFGSPFTWGYTAALGPDAGLGFGIDPWGNRYGGLEAIAYTSAELVALGVRLLETPIPLVAAIGLWLVLAPRLAAGERIVLAWALAPVAANLFYWHHGLFMGPRMLADVAPAWSLLGGLAIAGLVEGTRVSFRPAAGQDARSAWSPRAFAVTVFTVAILSGVVWFAPASLASHAQPPSPALAATARAETPALVFVHGDWRSRIAMRLAAAGMRLDSVETAIRQNPTCTVQRYLDGTARRNELDFTPRATAIQPHTGVSPGSRIIPSRAMPPACQREIAADARGTVEVATLYWKSDLPEVNADGVMFVRDLGPEENARFMAMHPERRVYALLTRAPDALPELVPFADGMTMLWRSAAGKERP